MWQLLRGVYEVVPKDLLSVFDYQELQLLMSGLPSKRGRKGGSEGCILCAYSSVDNAF